MGREIKRVPLNFDWPLNKVWPGFLNPYWEQSTPCPDCNGSGYSPEAKWWSDAWYGDAEGYHPGVTGSTPLIPEDEIVWAFAKRNVEQSPEFYGVLTNQNIYSEALRLVTMWNRQWSHHLDQDDVQALIEGNRLFDFTREFIHGQGWQPKNPPYTPTATEVNRWNITTMGHDSINQYVCVKARVKKLGYELECRRCQGEGDLWPSAEAKSAYDNWEPQEPPQGKGWQVWETVSEGSPISPVFITADALENWLIQQGYSEGAVEQFTKSGWVPSMVMVEDMQGNRDIRQDIESLNISRE